MHKTQQSHINTIIKKARKLCEEMEVYYGQDLFAAQPHTIENDAYNVLQSFIVICKDFAHETGKCEQTGCKKKNYVGSAWCWEHGKERARKEGL